MNPVIAIFSVVISYLVGSISFARVISRIVDPSLDIENIHLQKSDGSQGDRLQTIGGTTASIKLGPKVGCAIGLLDILKGVIPVMAFKYFFPNQHYHLLSAIFVVIGHNWPIFYRFKGGAGISPTYGGFFVVDFWGTVISSFTGLIFGLFIIKDILVAYMSGLWFFLLWLIIFKGDLIHIVYGVIINIIFTIALIPQTKDYIRKKRAGKVDMEEGLEAFPMGRGMLKIMNFFRVEPRRKGQE